MGLDSACPRHCERSDDDCPLRNNRITRLERLVREQAEALKVLSVILDELSTPEIREIAALRTRQAVLQREVVEIESLLGSVNVPFTENIREYLREKREALERVESELDAKASRRPA